MRLPLFIALLLFTAPAFASLPCAGKNCPAPAPTLASPARKQAAPVKKLASKERSAVIRRGKSTLKAPNGRGLKPFANRCPYGNRPIPRFHGIGPRGWQSARYRR